MHAIALGRRRPVGPGVRRSWTTAEAASSGGRILGRGGDLRLILADNYNRATTGHHRGTERTEDAQRLLKRNSWQSPASSSLLDCGRQRPVAARPWLLPCPAPGCARGCCHRAGPSGLAALSSGRAGGRSGLRAGKSRAGVNSFSGAGFWLWRHFVITISG